MWLSLAGAVVMAAASVVVLPFALILGVALLLGGTINPLYSLLIAHTNDFLQKEDMPGASAGLIFLNGFGAIFGPLVSGWFMAKIGQGGYFLFLGLLFLALAAYSGFRMLKRAAPTEHGAFAGFTPNASSLAVGAVVESAMEKDPRRSRAG
jgi:MFS family permease